MSSRRSWLKLIAALIALAVALFMNHVYDKDIVVRTSTAPEDNEFISQLSTYSYKEIAKICDKAALSGKIKTAEIALDFAPPVPTEERKTMCPWGRGDNLAPRAGQLMARYEQVHVANLPEKAVVCSLDIKIDSDRKPIEHRDFYVLALNGIILSSDAEFLFKFYREEKTQVSGDQEVRSYMFDWARVLGARRPASLDESVSREYCIGRDITMSTCDLTQATEPYIKLNDRLAQWLGSRGMGSNQRFTMIVTGDKDESTDCYHSAFKLKAKFGYADQ